MDINKRVQDIDKVFDRKWQVNNNNTQRKEFLDGRKQHFNRMFNIKDKTDRRQEILKASSVNGQVESLNQRMSAMTNGQRIARMNNFKDNFR